MRSLIRMTQLMGLVLPCFQDLFQWHSVVSFSIFYILLSLCSYVKRLFKITIMIRHTTSIPFRITSSTTPGSCCHYITVNLIIMEIYMFWTYRYWIHDDRFCACMDHKMDLDSMSPHFLFFFSPLFCFSKITFIL